MSNREPNNPHTMGYFLPEDSQFRLKKLRDHMEFLSRLAQPRTSNEDREWAPELRPGDVAVCLELLAEQAGRVLAEASWMALPDDDNGGAPGSGRQGVSAECTSGGLRECSGFGVTVDQIDTLNHLIQMISAHGDAIAGSGSAELADHTLPLLGQAIFDGADAVREILDQIEAQRLAASPSTGVGEERAVYDVAMAAGKKHPLRVCYPSPWKARLECGSPELVAMPPLASAALAGGLTPAG